MGGGSHLIGVLPVIDEQIRYNNGLITAVAESSHNVWHCATCLSRNSHMMPNLKQMCKPCANMDDELKPRKVLNRLPDLDMWTVCDEKSISFAKDQIVELFGKNSISSSDTNPIKTMYDVGVIAEALKMGVMPNRIIPIDAHIIGYSKLFSLIEQVPYVLKSSLSNGEVPYLPILPLSYRKDWQHDDSAYNFIYDYLSAFTEFNFDDSLNSVLSDTRNAVATNYSPEQL